MLGIMLDHKSKVSLKRQIYNHIKDGIMTGRIKAGEALPSTRDLSKYLAISRQTVCEAYDMLLSEGFTESRQGAPTRAIEGLNLGYEATHQMTQSPKQKKAVIKADFSTGQPDLRCFPGFAWQQSCVRGMSNMSLDQLGYTDSQGLEALRDEISAWLYRSRGMIANPRDIFVTTGTTLSLHILSSILYREEKDIVVEDPCHMGMLRALRQKRYSICPVPVDAHGLQVEQLNGTRACMVYVTPSHQFPLGGILPAVRRAELIRLAQKNGFYILEDDYDSEFRYCGEPVAPLYSMDNQQVIYIGTFSKILFPALRVGYIILPESLHKRWQYFRTHTDVQNSPFEQAALAEFLKTRKLDKHILKMKRLYGERRSVLLKSLEELFGQSWRSWGDAAGLHLAVQFPGREFDKKLIQKCKDAGVNFRPVEYHSILKGGHCDKILLGYGHMEPDEIRNAVGLLSEMINPPYSV